MGEMIPQLLQSPRDAGTDPTGADWGGGGGGGDTGLRVVPSSVHTGKQGQLWGGGLLSKLFPAAPMPL